LTSGEGVAEIVKPENGRPRGIVECAHLIGSMNRAGAGRAISRQRRLNLDLYGTFPYDDPWRP
jgi:hypothetical protein